MQHEGIVWIDRFDALTNYFSGLQKNVLVATKNALLVCKEV